MKNTGDWKIKLINTSEASLLDEVDLLMQTHLGSILKAFASDLQ